MSRSIDGLDGLDPVADSDLARWLLTPQRIAESGKIQTNMGIIYATIGEHESAVRPVPPLKTV